MNAFRSAAGGRVSRNWVDPFDEVTDEEFDADVGELFSARPGSVAVSLRVAPDLLGPREAPGRTRGVPYQTFMKSILAAAVSRLERRREASPPARRTCRRT